MLLEGGVGSPTQSDSFSAFDFRRPSKFGVSHVRSLEGLHESFARRFASALTQALRAVVQLKPIAVDELTYENYVRSLPNPSVMSLITLSPLPGHVLLEMNPQMGLILVDRVLGGLGKQGATRRPTDLERQLVGEVVQHSIGAFEETFAPVLEVTPEITSVESNPHFVQAVPPTETVLLLSYNFSLSASESSEGLLTICYPYSTLQPVLDRLELHAASEVPALEAGDEIDALISDHLNAVSVDMRVRLNTTKIPAPEIAALRPGDILRFDHRVEEPVLGLVHGRELLDGYVGRCGKRLGFRLKGWRSEDE